MAPLQKNPSRLKIPNFGALLKSNFLTGLLVLIPIGVIAWIVAWGVRSIWRLRDLLPVSWRPESFLPNPDWALPLNAALTVGAALILALCVSVLGWGSKQFLGRKALGLLSVVIERIPVIRGIYSALDQLLRTLAAGGGHQFSRVVYVEYPRKGMWTLAFVTGPSHSMPGHLNLYVPTTPNPTSGFYVIVPESDVREAHMKVDEAFRAILSLGIVSSHHGTPLGR